ncbi:hypothetical protein B0H13DRAFT_1859669 [Mycena leptocephala]|nr:hypothetical protein B0H13DRAFT_1859669 [Mycena leptocephala]
MNGTGTGRSSLRTVFDGTAGWSPYGTVFGAHDLPNESAPMHTTREWHQLAHATSRTSRRPCARLGSGTNWRARPPGRIAADARDFGSATERVPLRDRVGARDLPDELVRKLCEAATERGLRLMKSDKSRHVARPVQSLQRYGRLVGECADALEPYEAAANASDHYGVFSFGNFDDAKISRVYANPPPMRTTYATSPPMRKSRRGRRQCAKPVQSCRQGGRAVQYENEVKRGSENVPWPVNPLSRRDLLSDTRMLGPKDTAAPKDIQKAGARLVAQETHEPLVEHVVRQGTAQCTSLLSPHRITIVSRAIIAGEVRGVKKFIGLLDKIDTRCLNPGCQSAAIIPHRPTQNGARGASMD